MTNKIYDRDQPVDGSQFEPDTLNRDSFAKHLAEIIHIKPDEDCFTLSVEGEWGSGKSSVLAMAKRHLKALDNPPIIIEFNPWLIGDVDSLVQKFIMQFAAQLNIPDRPQETLKAARELLSYSKLFDVAKLIPGAEPWASTFQAVFHGVGRAANKIGKLKELDVESRKDKVKNAVESLGKSIVVFIDDIDRLTPEEAFQVIRLSKAVADFRGTTFVLAFDHAYLADVLNARGIHNSDQYIEKIVQLRVPLPLTAMDAMHEMIDKGIDSLSEKSLTDKFKEDKERLASIYFKSARYLIRTPRDIKRIMNHLKFVLVQSEGEVCFTDLFLLSVIAISEPSIYQSIKDNPWAYIGSAFDDKLRFKKPEDVIKLEEDYRNKALLNVSDRDKKHVASIIRELFPLTSEDKFLAHSGNYDAAGRVASVNRLSVAMHYQVPKDQVSDNEVTLFILGEIDRDSYISSVCESGSLNRLLEILSNNIDLLVDNHLDVLLSIYKSVMNSKKLTDQEKYGGGFFDIGPYRRLVWLTRDVLDKLPDALPLLSQLFSYPLYLPITANILYLLQIQHGEVKSETHSEGDLKWVQKHEYDNLKTRWADTAVSAFSDNAFFELPNIAVPFYRLRSLDPELLKKIANTWLYEEGGIKKIANLLGQSGSDSSNGAFCSIKEEDLAEIFDMPLLKKLAQSELDSDQQLGSFYTAVYKSMVTGKKYYLIDGSEASRDW